MCPRHYLLTMFMIPAQVENGILLPSLRPALPFLDLHGVQRLDFHTSVLDEIRERLLQRVKILAATKDKNNLKILNDLLVKSFPVIKVSIMPAKYYSIRLNRVVPHINLSNNLRFIKQFLNPKLIYSDICLHYLYIVVFGMFGRPSLWSHVGCLILWSLNYNICAVQYCPAKYI